MSLRSEIVRTEGLVSSANRARQNINQVVTEYGGANSSNFEEIPENIRHMVKQYSKVALLEQIWETTCSSKGIVNTTINFNRFSFTPKDIYLIFQARKLEPNFDGTFMYAVIAQYGLPHKIGNEPIGTLFIMEDWDLDLVNKKIRISFRNKSSYNCGLRLQKVIAIGE